MACPSRRNDILLFGKGVRARIAWVSGNAQLEILRLLQLGFQGEFPLGAQLANLVFFGGRFSLLQEGEKEEALGKGKRNLR